MTSARGVLGVVISYYNARPPENLYKLIDQLHSLTRDGSKGTKRFQTQIVVSINAVENGLSLAL
jgi:hypothetical protein